MTERRRVVVTGIGAVTPLGLTAETTWSGMLAGRSGVRTIASFDPSRVTSRIAGEIPDFDASGVMTGQAVRESLRGCGMRGWIRFRAAGRKFWTMQCGTGSAG